MRSLARHLRYGFRGLLRAPGFASVAVLTLALGVGAGSAIFSIMNGLMLNALPWKDPSTLVALEIRKRGVDKDPRGSTPAQYAAFKQQSQLFEDFYAQHWDQVYLTDRDEPQLAIAPRATPNGFALLGIRALHGRTLNEADARPDAPRAIMLGERLWRERYGADPSIVGRKVEVNGEPTTVAGILAASQWYPMPQAEIVQPLDLSRPSPSHTDERLGISGRLKPGVTLAQAQAELTVIMGRLAAEYPQTDADRDVRPVLVRDRILTTAARRGVVVLMGAVGFVLLIVCANLANLLLARAAGREREIATRVALGATRGQIIVQLLTECAAIGLVALPFAVLITRWSLDYFLSLVPPGGAFMDQFFRLDRNVLLFAIAVTGATVLLFGLSPALRATRLDLHGSLKEGGQRAGLSAGSNRLRSSLVVLQIGLALSLLATSLLFMQSLAKMQHTDPGFDLDGGMAALVLLPIERYPDPARAREFYRRLDDGLVGLPGGARAAVTSNMPLDWEGPWRDFQIAGRKSGEREQMPRGRWSSVSSSYFGVLGLPILTGRGFTAKDDENSQPVAVISKALADQYFPGQDPLGKRIELTPLFGNGFVTEGERVIVGVVADYRSLIGLQRPVEEPRIYEPIQQQPVNAFFLVGRSAGDALAIGSVLRQRVKQLDSLMAVARMNSLRTQFENRLWQSIFFSRVMAILGGLALVLAAVGVFGVVSYSTAQRTREFGIRAALGAEPSQIAQLVLRKALTLAGSGVALGLVLAMLLSAVTRVMLYETNARDPVTLAGVSLLLIAITCIAAAAPTLRAVRVNPMTSLRQE